MEAGRAYRCQPRLPLAAGLLVSRSTRTGLLEGFLAMVGRAWEESSLPDEEEALSRFAGKVGRKVGVLAQLIEGRLATEDRP